jgi:hypothetical protein
LATLNEIILFKAFWAITTSTNSLWAEISRAEYQREGTLWTACLSPANSTNWKEIIQIRNKLQQKNYNEIRVWGDGQCN